MLLCIRVLTLLHAVCWVSTLVSVIALERDWDVPLVVASDFDGDVSLMVVFTTKVIL